MRTLKGRMADIASGRSGLKRESVERYRERWAQAGYEIPELSESPGPPVVKALQAQLVGPRHGVGTQLSRLLKRLGIQPTTGCNCEVQALRYDAAGIEWCEQHVPEIVADLLKAAEKRKGLALVPLKKWGAERLVKSAIRAAKRKAAG